MDRTALAAGSALLGSLVAALGCGGKPSPPSPDPAPLVLAELKAASPGPWRRGEPTPISITALERTADGSYPPSADNRRWSGPQTSRPHDEAARPRQPRTGRRDTETKKGATRPIGKPRVLAAMTAPVSPAAGPRPITPSSATQRRNSPFSPLRQQALARIRRGFRLAERNSPYQARAEFMAALALVARANDTRQSTGFYSAALVAAQVALAEGGDFQLSADDSQLDVARVVCTHKTTLLHDTPLSGLTPDVAGEHYWAYAQEKFAAAAAGEVDASMALLGWARCEIAAEAVDPPRGSGSSPRAIVLYQAATMADPMNFRAANELSAVLVSQGSLARARDVLIRSNTHAPHPSTHHHLAAVYTKLGQAQLAEQALSKAIASASIRRSERSGRQDPRNFASTTGASASLRPSARASRPDASNVSTAARGQAGLPPYSHR